MQQKIGIFLFNEVEVLDFAGPFEVFSLASDLQSNQKLYQVHTVGETGKPISARNGLVVQPDYSFEDHPEFDILIIPGGYGAEEIEIHNEKVLHWIKEQASKVKLLASVCTGAFLLAKCGLLDGKKATTHWMDIDRLEQEFPKISVLREMKYVDQGEVITSGGISAGINMSFYIITKEHGKDVAKFTAKRMEYDIVL